MKNILVRSWCRRLWIIMVCNSRMTVSNSRFWLKIIIKQLSLSTILKMCKKWKVLASKTKTYNKVNNVILNMQEKVTIIKHIAFHRRIQITKCYGVAICGYIQDKDEMINALKYSHCVALDSDYFNKKFKEIIGERTELQNRLRDHEQW